MKNRILKISSKLVYGIYAYLFGWQIYQVNQNVFYDKTIVDDHTPMFKYIPAIVLFLFGVLLYCNIILRQRKILIFDCFLAAALLSFYENTGSVVLGVAFCLFGFITAILEMKGNN